jgi:hypothetical protein
MTDDVRKLGLDFAKFLSGVSPEMRKRVNERSRKEATEQHKVFKEKFKTDQCSFCDAPLTAFDESKPCRHWLLKPEGFSKKHFELLAKEHSWSVLENYLRWVANEEVFAQNINDLADEGTGKLVELTIKHKNIAWSFSCGANDLTGHEGGGEPSKQPHYHFQMYVDGKPFIRYNDFHLPLSVTDIGFLEHMRNNPGNVQKRLAGGAGMGELLDETTLDHIVSMARPGTTDQDTERRLSNSTPLLSPNLERQSRVRIFTTSFKRQRRKVSQFLAKQESLRALLFRQFCLPAPVSFSRQHVREESGAAIGCLAIKIANGASDRNETYNLPVPLR